MQSEEEKEGPVDGITTITETGAVNDSKGGNGSSPHIRRVGLDAVLPQQRLHQLVVALLTRGKERRFAVQGRLVDVERRREKELQRGFQVSLFACGVQRALLRDHRAGHVVGGLQ